MLRRIKKKKFEFSLLTKVKDLLNFFSNFRFLLFAGMGVGIVLIYLLFSPLLLYHKIGITFIMGIFISIFAVGMVRFHREFLTSKYLLLCLIILLFTALMSRIIMELPQIPDVFIPFAFLSIFLALFFNMPLAIFALSMLSILFAIVSGEFWFLPVWFSGGMAGVYGASMIHKRTDITKVGIWIGLASFCSAFGVGIINDLTFPELISWGAWGLGSGIFSSVLVSITLPYFETYFGTATDIRLLELIDLNHPLLHRLSIEAPGTYHHTMTVASLAVAAAKSVGANPLLARVGAYYHDIGKVTRPHFFFENSQKGTEEDYHSMVSPNLSSLIIISHVKDGVELAKIFRLPQVAIDIIPQHHGTSLIAYFYRKALLKRRREGSVDEASFRYPGPKPQTKEAAIIMLADAVEADGRYFSWKSLKEINIRVEKVIHNKLKDHQLSDVNLSLRDLNLIEKSFVQVLTGIAHTRKRYPEEMLNSEEKNLKNQQYV